MASARINLLRAVMLTMLAAGLALWGTPAAADDAAATYKAKCAMCHGADGKGDTPVGKKMGIHDFASAEVQKASDGDLIAIITKGKNKMPAYENKLSAAQIKEIVTYIRSLPKVSEPGCDDSRSGHRWVLGRVVYRQRGCSAEAHERRLPRLSQRRRASPRTSTANQWTGTSIRTNSRTRCTAACLPASIATPTSRLLPTRPCRPKSPVRTCHREQQAAYDRSLHAQSIQGKQPAATCTDCHGSPHELLPSSDPKSRTNHANIPATCGSCHSVKFVMEATGRTTQPFVSYQESVHGQAVAKGVEKAAVCTDCHGAHDIMTAADPKSPIFKFNVPHTCGKCHGPVEREFEQSIHGQAIARGDWQAPICTDCHGIHSIKSHKDPASQVSTQNLACAHCHEGVQLTQEFGFEGNRVTTYLASYHGLASRRGSTLVANCASCHGVHNILPSSDSRSSVNPANLVKTCGQCHRGVTEQFVAAKVHVNAPLSSDTGSIVVRWVRRFYVRSL